MPPASSRDDFLVTRANRDALAMLDAPQGWPQGRLLLVGGAGAGKSHLAGFWADERGAQIVQAWSLTPQGADALVPADGALVIEDGHEIGGNAQAEQGLFHLWNLAGARQCLLLITARSVPRDWGIGLADLRSRLDTAVQALLVPPDDALLPAVLVKLFADRQIQVAPEVIDWLALRMDRDLDLARRLVAAMDRESLADRRAISRRLAAELLDKLAAPDP
ncbi:dnaA protein [Paracoccus halophilus]|uniref:Chromosomal replication initiator protein DnaA n=2 Tax=Paracoccus halophilus TaxID=376733 RepID=A0A099F7X0_9RHOB|nr:chromosomal replication initiator protein DnaA [Paracoccus halophilus]SFA45685.1 dnaA protein [Paracoccus halophilus]